MTKNSYVVVLMLNRSLHGERRHGGVGEEKRAGAGPFRD